MTYIFMKYSGVQRTAVPCMIYTLSGNIVSYSSAICFCFCCNTRYRVCRYSRGFSGIRQIFGTRYHCCTRYSSNTRYSECRLQVQKTQVPGRY